MQPTWLNNTMVSLSMVALLNSTVAILRGLDLKINTIHMVPPTHPTVISSSKITFRAKGLPMETLVAKITKKISVLIKFSNSISKDKNSRRNLGQPIKFLKV